MYVCSTVLSMGSVRGKRSGENKKHSLYHNSSLTTLSLNTFPDSSLGFLGGLGLQPRNLEPALPPLCLSGSSLHPHSIQTYLSLYKTFCFRKFTLKSLYLEFVVQEQRRKSRPLTGKDMMGIGLRKPASFRRKEIILPRNPILHKGAPSDYSAGNRPMPLHCQEARPTGWSKFKKKE